MTDKMEHDNVKWKTGLCNVGEECWCRSILTINDDMVYDAGNINKEFADYIISLHNNHIDYHNQYKK